MHENETVVRMVEIGDEAPNVIVKSVNNGQVNTDINLEELYREGTIVLYFFPLAFTGVCTNSNLSLRDDLDEFNKLNVKVYAISVDSPFVLQEFAKKHNLTHTLLSDFNKEAIKAFDVVHDDLAGLQQVAKRSLFVIKDGKITFKWVTDNPGDFPPFEELKEHLKSISQ